MDTPGPGAYRLKPPLRRAVGHIKNVARYGYPYLRTKMKLRKQKHIDESSRVKTLRTVFVQRAANYQPKPYRGRIMLFMLSQRSAMSDSLFDPELGDISPSLGWESIALGGLESYELKGEHVSILREPFVRELGERLREGLNRQQQK
jgi:thioesterase domain-containing protein